MENGVIYNTLCFHKIFDGDHVDRSKKISEKRIYFRIYYTREWKSFTIFLNFKEKKRTLYKNIRYFGMNTRKNKDVRTTFSCNVTKYDRLEYNYRLISYVDER